MKNPRGEILLSLAAKIMSKNLRAHIGDQRGTGGGAELVSDNTQFLTLAGKPEDGFEQPTGGARLEKN